MSARTRTPQPAAPRRARSGEAGFTLIETLVSFAIAAAVLTGVGALVLGFARAGTQSSVLAAAHSQLKASDTGMSGDIARAQTLYPSPGGFSAKGAGPVPASGPCAGLAARPAGATACLWESVWAYEGSDMAVYRWFGTAPADSAPAGKAAILSAGGSRAAISHGLGLSPAALAAAYGAPAAAFSYYNAAGYALTVSADGLNATGTSGAGLPAAAGTDPALVAQQKADTGVSRITWNLASAPGLTAGSKRSDPAATDTGGGSKTQTDRIVSGRTSCPAPTVTQVGPGPAFEWADSGADHYQIYRDDAGLIWTEDAGASGSYRYIDPAPRSDRVSLYTFKLVTDAHTGVAAPVCAAVAYVPAPAVSAAFSLADPATGAGTFTASWPAIAGASYSADYQRLDYETDAPTGPWTALATAGASASLPAAAGDEVQFRATASSGAATSANSNTARALAGPPAAVMISQNFAGARAASNTVANPDEFPLGGNTAKTNSVHWRAAKAAVGYRVYGSADGGASTLLATVAQPAGAAAGSTVVSSPTFPNAAWGSATVYTVVAYNLGPNGAGATRLSPDSNPKSILQYPPAPVITAPGTTGTDGKTGTTDGDKVNTVRWAAAKSADAAHLGGYHVQRGFSNGAGADAAKTCLAADGLGQAAASLCAGYTGGSAATSLADRTPAASTRYSYSVRSYNKTGVSAYYSGTATLTQRADSPALTVAVATGLASSATTLTVPQAADTGNPAAYRWCRVGQTSPVVGGGSTCLYMLMTGGAVVDWNPQAAGTSNPFTEDPGWGGTFDYQARVFNGSLYSPTAANGWSSSPGPVNRVLTYPGPFSMNMVSAAALTAKGGGAQYDWQAVSGAAPEAINDGAAATVDLSWGAAAGAGLSYRYAVWAAGTPAGYDSGFGAARSAANVAIADGGYVYNLQVQARSANGLTRGGGDPATGKPCLTTGGGAQCTAAFQSSPLLPARIGEVQQFVPGTKASPNVYGHARWAVDYTVAGSPIAGGSYANWDYYLSGWGWRQGGAATSGTTAVAIKGGSSRFSFTIQARSTRAGVMNVTAVSQQVVMSLASGNPNVWAAGSCGGRACDDSAKHDAPYTPDNYLSSYGLGFIRYTTRGDVWAQPGLDPNTSWTAW